MPGPSIGRLFGLVRPLVAPLVLASFLLMLQSGVTLVAPRLAGFVVDDAIANRLDRLDTIVIVLVSLFAVRSLIVYWQTYLLAATGARMLRLLRRLLFGHLLTLAPDFYENRRVGELLSRLSADLGQVQNVLTTSIPSGIRAVITLVGTMSIVVFLHVELTAVALAALAPLPLVAVYFGKRLQRISTQVQDSVADTTAIAEEAISGIHTVQAFDRHAHESQRYDHGLAALVAVQVRAGHVVGRYYGLIGFLGFGAFALVLWYGGRLIAADELTTGELTAFLLYMFALGGSVGSLGRLYAGLRELRGTSARVFEILDTEPTIADADRAVALDNIRGGLRLSGVSYRYPSAEQDRWALRDIDLEIAPGEIVALVGPSGAGKTTLMSLLLRFDDPTEGHIALDGTDMRAATLASIRGAMAVVPQEVFLFSGTIEDNIRYGSLAATDEQVRAAAESAGAASFIDALANGYRERIGPRGVKLSAGQRQRLAIARAFLKEPKILLLDEATSALDAESEEIVQQAITRLMQGRTAVIIAHRLATARRADRIVVLDEGRIVGMGTHEQLHEQNEIYRRYWTLQSLD